VRTALATTAATCCLLAATLAGSAAAAPAAKITLCGQLSGPHATYIGQLTGKKLSGSRWTVIATGVPCTTAMKAAPAILRWWAQARVDASSGGTLAGGYTCTKENDGHGSSGSAGCVLTKGNSQTIQLYMTGPYTIAQLKQRFGG
jgi:hypothetical protein